MMYYGKWVICLLELMYFVVNFQGVPLMWRFGCLNHTACVYMVLVCGVAIKLVLWITLNLHTTGAWWFSLDTAVFQINVTQLLLDLGLPSWNTLLINSQSVFVRSWQICENSYVRARLIIAYSVCFSIWLRMYVCVCFILFIPPSVFL